MYSKNELIKKYLAFNRFKDTDLAYRLLYSELVNQYMVITEEKIIFDDSTEYNQEELAYLQGLSPQMVIAIHASKKLFGESLRLMD